MYQSLTSMRQGQIFRTPTGRKVRYTLTRKVGPNPSDLEAHFEYLEARQSVGGKAMPELLTLRLPNFRILVAL